MNLASTDRGGPLGHVRNGQPQAQRRPLDQRLRHGGRRKDQHRDEPRRPRPRPRGRLLRSRRPLRARRAERRAPVVGGPPRVRTRRMRGAPGDAARGREGDGRDRRLGEELPRLHRHQARGGEAMTAATLTWQQLRDLRTSELTEAGDAWHQVSNRPDPGRPGHVREAPRDAGERVGGGGPRPAQAPQPQLPVPAQRVRPRQDDAQRPRRRPRRAADAAEERARRRLRPGPHRPRGRLRRLPRRRGHRPGRHGEAGPRRHRPRQRPSPPRGADPRQPPGRLPWLPAAQPEPGEGPVRRRPHRPSPALRRRGRRPVRQDPHRPEGGEGPRRHRGHPEGRPPGHRRRARHGRHVPRRGRAGRQEPRRAQEVVGRPDGRAARGVPGGRPGPGRRPRRHPGHGPRRGQPHLPADPHGRAGPGGRRRSEDEAGRPARHPGEAERAERPADVPPRHRRRGQRPRDRLRAATRTRRRTSRPTSRAWGRS